MHANRMFLQVTGLLLQTLPFRVHGQYRVDTNLKDSGPDRIPSIPETAISLPFI